MEFSCNLGVDKSKGSDILFRMITRAQYMANSTELHDAYYRQFVSPAIKRIVSDAFDVALLKDRLSKDKHLNNIGLSHWDMLAGYTPLRPGFGDKIPMRGHLPFSNEHKALGADNSLATAVCVLKAAARMIVEENS